MTLPRFALRVFATVLVPAGCVAPVPCDGSLCLSIADVSRVRVGVAPDALALADVDGDGARDLVGASGPAGTISVVWGSPAGFTGSATTWSIDQEVAGIVVADLDADGRLDLATALPRADAVALVRSRGGRSFAEPERFSAGAVPRALIAADLDGHAPPELLTADLEDGTITVLHQLVAAPPLVVGPGPRALAAGDLDGDGHLDVAVALADADAVQLLRGDGRGALWPDALLPVGAAPYGLVVADLDGDEDLDLATADSLDDTVSVLLGSGAGDFQPRRAWPTVALPSALAVAEPADSLPVLGVLSETTSTVERLDPRTGAAVAGVLATYPRSLVADGGTLVSGGGALSDLSPGTGLVLTPAWEGPGALDVWPVDLDGDGVDELLLDDLQAASGQLTLQRGDDSFLLEVGTSRPDGVGAADLSGDGRPDLFLRDDDNLRVLVQRASGELAPAVVTEVADAADAALADIDGDGIAEVIALVSFDGGGRIEVYRSDVDGALTLSLATAFTVADPPTSFAVIDGDGDALPDLLLRNSGSVFHIEDVYGPLRALTFGEHYATHPATSDLDRDGRLDAVFCTHLGGYAAYDFLAPVPAEPVPLGVGTCGDLEVLDLDGDDELELLALEFVPGDQEEAVLRATPWHRSGHAYEAGGSRVLKGFGSGFVFAELDGVAPRELLFSHPRRSAAFRAEVGTTLLETELLRLDARPQLRFGDVDGDGAADLFVLGGSLAVARADGRGGFGPLTQFWGGRETRSGLLDAVVIDPDDDGHAQLVWSAGDELRSTIELADVGADGLSARVLLGELYGPQSRLFVADLDGDGERDVVSFDVMFGSLRGSLFRGRGQGRFDEVQPLELVQQFAVHGAGLHHVDDDGRVDLVLTTLPIGDRESGIFVLPGRGDGTFGAPREWSPVTTNLFEPPPVEFADLDRDGHPELITGNIEGSLLWVRDGGRAPRVLLADIDAYATADLDRDGHPELLAAAPAPFSLEATRLHLGRSRSDGSFGFEHHDIEAAGVREIQTADVDGDGELDIVLVDDGGLTVVRRTP